MKKSILIILASIFLSYPISLMGTDYETPHEFKAGDTISAEMFNELFEYIKQSNVSLDAESLVGLWKGLVIKNYKTGCSGSWTSSTDQLYIYLNLSITFSSDGDGTYSFVTSNPQPFDSCSQTVTLSSPYEVVNNILIFKDSVNSNQIYAYSIKKTSKTRIILELIKAANSKAPPFVILDKQNIAPNPPSSLTYANSSSSITLTWTDNNTEVTGYKVLRKTVVTDDFTTVSTITDNSTRTYADTNVSTGSYWYRVRAYNSNGDGTPSKVVKSDFP